MISHLLVFIQFIGIALSSYPNESVHQNYYYLIISLLGILCGVYTLVYNRLGNFNIYPEVKSNAKLITTGPYSFIRHPMYTALLLASIGLTFSPYRTWKVITTCTLALVLATKSEIEERQLRSKFVEYEAYTRKTKRFIPLVW